MMNNRLITNWKQGTVSYGTFTQLKSDVAIENIACSPFDFIIVDGEHQEISTDIMMSAIATAAASGLTPMVRICEISRRAVLHPLDAGAAGLIIPAIKTPEEVRQLAAYAKFAPIGDRGYLTTRDCRWGTEPDFTPVSYMEEANRQTMLLPQCETKECLEHLEEIVSIDGVDGIFVGPMDLSISLGYPLQLDAPVVQDVLRRILDVCKAHHKFVMTFATDAETARKYASMGYNSVCVGDDTILLVNAYRTLAQQLRG